MAAFIGWPFLFMTAIGAALTACQTFRVSIATSFILRFGIEVSVDSRSLKRLRSIGEEKGTEPSSVFVLAGGFGLAFLRRRR